MDNTPGDLLGQIPGFLGASAEKVATTALEEATKQIVAKQFDSNTPPAPGETTGEDNASIPKPVRKWRQKLRSFFGNHFTIVTLISVFTVGSMISYLEFFAAKQQEYETVYLTGGGDTFPLNSLMSDDDNEQELLWDAIMDLCPEQLQAYNGKFSLSVARGRRILKIRLKDSTLVILGPSSSVVLNEGYGNGTRKITLEGKAIFKVPFYRDKPLIIQTGAKEISTKKGVIAVTAYPESDYEASLIEGKMTAKLGNEPFEPDPGKAVIQRWKTQKPVEKSIDTSLALSWQKGCYAFIEQPLYEVFKQLERLHSVQIVVDDARTGFQPYTGFIYKAHSLLDVLESLKQTDNIAYNFDNCGIVHVSKRD